MHAQTAVSACWRLPQHSPSEPTSLHVEYDATSMGPPSPSAPRGQHVLAATFFAAISSKAVPFTGDDLQTFQSSHQRQYHHWKQPLSRISAHTGCDACSAPTHHSVGVAAAAIQGAQTGIERPFPPPSTPHLDGRFLLSACCPTQLAEASMMHAAAKALRHRDQLRAHAAH
jgi:hypothetical protein